MYTTKQVLAFLDDDSKQLKERVEKVVKMLCENIEELNRVKSERGRAPEKMV